MKLLKKGSENASFQKKVLITLLIVLILITSVNAVLEPEELPGIIDTGAETAGNLVPALVPLIEYTSPIFKKISLLVGGIFGLYLILIITRIYYERKKVRLLKDIRYDLDNLNMHYGLRYSRLNRGLVRRTITSIKHRSQEKEKNSSKIKKTSIMKKIKKKKT